MEEGVRTRLTPARQGRKFAFTIGTAFLVITGLLIWRGRNLTAGLCGFVGGILWLAGLVVPTKLLIVERAWMRMARGISIVTTPIFLGIVYFGVVTPIAIIIRLLKGNPLVHSEMKGSYWVSRDTDQTGRGGMERQF